mgnify:CR=1 FL=1
MSRRTTQFNQSRAWDGLIRFEYAPTPVKIGPGEVDPVAELERLVRDQGERIARREAAWSVAIARKMRYAKQ